MNVKELIAELEKIEDWGLEVTTAGCDCDGNVASVEVREDMKDVYLNRG